jgi:5-methylcytosine-specific restriction endonuclease McrBC GTP-binding regulatory subunit McrB
MLLDEMNLARVEHYFSDWLSCTESRRLQGDGSIIQHPVPLHRSEKTMEARLIGLDGSSTKVPVPANLELPTNLAVTGTVNVDETTYGFSPKVLDRAMVIEFDDVDLNDLRKGAASVSGDPYRFPNMLPPFRLASKQDYAALPEETHKHLSEINDILEEARLHFGYRSANEIALFISIYTTILPEDPKDPHLLRALDAAILQKVLPRLSGNRAKLEAPLAKLCAYLRDLKPPEAEVTLEDFDIWFFDAALLHSYRRAVEMLRALRDFGFVSFFK